MLEKRDLEMIGELIQPLHGEIRGVKVTLENETDRSIQIIVEGHLDLSRKINEVLKMKEDDEMVRMRLNRLEREMETVKKKIG